MRCSAHHLHCASIDSCGAASADAASFAGNYVTTSIASCGDASADAASFAGNYVTTYITTVIVATVERLLELTVLP